MKQSLYTINPRRHIDNDHRAYTRAYTRAYHC